MQVGQANFKVDYDFYLCHSGSLYKQKTGTCLLRKYGFQEFILPLPVRCREACGDLGSQQGIEPGPW